MAINYDGHFLVDQKDFMLQTTIVFLDFKTGYYFFIQLCSDILLLALYLIVKQLYSLLQITVVYRKTVISFKMEKSEDDALFWAIVLHLHGRTFSLTTGGLAPPLVLWWRL